MPSRTAPRASELAALASSPRRAGASRIRRLTPGRPSCVMAPTRGPIAPRRARRAEALLGELAHGAAAPPLRTRRTAPTVPRPAPERRERGSERPATARERAPPTRRGCQASAGCWSPIVSTCVRCLKRPASAPIRGVMAFDVDAALRYVVEREGSDLHVKVPAPADGAHPRRARAGGRAPSRCTRRGHRGGPRARAARRGAARGVRRRRRGRLLLRDPRARALPRQRLPPARLDLDRLPRDPLPGPVDRRPRAARR